MLAMLAMLAFELAQSLYMVCRCLMSLMWFNRNENGEIMREHPLAIPGWEKSDLNRGLQLEQKHQWVIFQHAPFDDTGR